MQIPVNRTDDVIAWADAVLVVSGTATLQVAALDCICQPFAHHPFAQLATDKLLEVLGQPAKTP